MRELMTLVKDLHFWFGAGLFAASVAGIVWILKSLQNHSDDTASLLMNEPPPQPGIARKAGAEPPAQEPATRIVPAQPSAAHDAASIETLARQMDAFEQTLNKILLKLDQADKIGRGENSEELKSAIQALKSTTPAAETSDSENIRKIALKIDKIYQVLSTLSGTEGK